MVQGTRRKASYKSHKLLTVPKNEWIRVKGTHEAIISPECFSAAQSLQKMRQKSDGSGNISPLSGLVKCLACGRTMQKNSYYYQGIRQNYLRCPGRGDHCASSVRLDDLYILIEERLKAYIQEASAPDRPIPPSHRSASTLKFEKIRRELSGILSRLNDCSSSLKSLYLDKTSGLLSKEQFQLLSVSISKEIESLELRKTLYQNILDRRCEHTKNLSHFRNAKNALLNQQLPRDLFLACLLRIDVEARNPRSHVQNIHVHWKF